MLLLWGILVSERRSGEEEGKGPRPPVPSLLLSQHLGKQGRRKGLFWSILKPVCADSAGYWKEGSNLRGLVGEVKGFSSAVFLKYTHMHIYLYLQCLGLGQENPGCLSGLEASGQ